MNWMQIHKRIEIRRTLYLLSKQRSRLTPMNLSYSVFLKDKLSDDQKIWALCGEIWRATISLVGDLSDLFDTL